MNDAIRSLEPRALWNRFADLNEIPRPSKREERAVAFVKNFGEQHGLETVVDQVGNVRIRKPASPGKEGRPVVVLQAHLDMVHQKNADTVFDFEREGIRMQLEGDWVKAQGTTLGADNGLGVAAILALLEADDIPHPPLEALFTIDEETGMTGARSLSDGFLSGKILLNLDTEEDHVLTIGCAGGIDTNTWMKYQEEAPAADAQAFRIAVRGLRGGHSGVDIHLGRGNANKILVRLLYGMNFGLRIASVDGGGLRNAIPREAFATIVVHGRDAEAFQSAFEERAGAIRQEYRRPEPGLEISLESAALPGKVMQEADQLAVLRSLYAVHNGVFRMSPEIPGLVESSSNLARVLIQDGEFRTQSLQRSNIESGKEDVANAIRAVFEAIGAAVENGSSYPGWAPDPDSPVLRLMVEKYQDLFGDKPTVEACHAGLECGIIGDHHPGMQMVSFGPTIQHAHSPDERASISSAAKFWQYLLAILDSI